MNYTIHRLLKLKRWFRENPGGTRIVEYDEWKRPIWRNSREFHLWFMEYLNEEINRNLPVYKKMGREYQMQFWRDKWAIERRRKGRIMIRSFESRACRERLAHLIFKDD